MAGEFWRGFLKQLAEGRKLGEVSPIGFYSQLEREAERLPQAMRGRDALNYLRDPKRGVKEGELEHTGLKRLLEERADDVLQPDEIRQYLKENRVDVTEIRKGGDVPYDPNKRREAPKYGSYTEPGGENYREVLLRRNNTSKIGHEKINTDINKLLNEEASTYGQVRRNDALARESSNADEIRQESRRLLNENLRVQNKIGDLRRVRDELPKVESFKSGHFEEDDILAHLRLKERRDADGKRTLHAEELQSDWAQTGRKEGFKKSPSLSPQEKLEYEVMFRQSLKDQSDDWDDAKLDRYNELSKKYIADQDPEIISRENQNRPPKGPFVEKTEDWTKLGMKRLLRMAAEEGYDRVSWTTGKQQAKRYDLSRDVWKIEYNPVDDKTTALEIIGHNNAQRLHGNMADHIPGASYDQKGSLIIPNEQIEKLIGKELSDRISKEGKKGNWRSLETKD